MGIRKIYGVVLPTGSAVQAPPNSTNFDIKLGDAAGARYFRIVDSSTAEMFKVDSDGNVTVQGTLGSSGTFTVGGTFTASSSGLVSGNLTVSKTITGSSALSAAAPSSFASSLTVGGTLAGSSNATVGGSLTVSSGLGVTAASTFSAGVTASSNITASRGVTVPRAVASSSANLASYGLLDITSTAAQAMVIDAPVAGREVWIYKTANSTAICSVTVNATGTVTWDGTNTALTFNGQNQFAHAIGNSSTRWLLLDTTGTGGYSIA